MEAFLITLAIVLLVGLVRILRVAFLWIFGLSGTIITFYAAETGVLEERLLGILLFFGGPMILLFLIGFAKRRAMTAPPSPTYSRPVS